MNSLRLRDYEYIRGILEQEIENWLDQERNWPFPSSPIRIICMYLEILNMSAHNELEIVVKHL